MSGRIKELIREDMGFSILSPFREKYQLDILESARNNKAVVLIKSRQMWISELLLSIAIDSLLTKKQKGKSYSCTFVCCNQSNAQAHMKRFIQLCENNRILMQEYAKKSNQVRLMNDAYINFETKITSGIAGDIVIFDEMAFNKSVDNETLNLLLASGSKIIASSTPKKGSFFNELAKETLLGKNNYAHVIAHWTMNSIFQNNMIAVAEPMFDGSIRFKIEHGDIQHMMGDPKLYAEEIECFLV